MNFIILQFKKYWAFLLIAFFFLMLSWNWPLYADDAVYQNALNAYGGIANWTKYYFDNWSGRLLPNILLIYLLNMPSICFSLINSAAIAIMILYFIKNFIITDNTMVKNVVALLLACALLTWIDDEMLKGTIFWRSAAVSYIWGLAGALLAIYPFAYHYYDRNDDKLKVKDYILAILGVVYAANYEQSAVFMIFMMFMFYLFRVLKKGPRPISDLLLLILGIAITIFCLSAPGNAVRYNAEVLGHMQKYEMFGTIDKLVWGICYCLTGLRRYCAPLMAAISLLLIVHSYVFHKNKQIKACALLVGAYYIIMLISIWAETKAGTDFALPLFNFISVDSPDFITSRLQITVTVIGIFVYIVTVLLTFLASEALDISAASLLTAAFGVTVMIGLSPTIYASGARVLFYCSILLLFTAFRLVSPLLTKARKL